MVGKLNLILGPMFSEKTTELDSRRRKYTIGGKKCLMVKYRGDNRYSTEEIVTHDGIKIQATVCEMLYEIDDQVGAYDVICIDEIQFYKDGDIFCEKWANEGKIVEACGLNGTFKRTPFHIISKIVPLAEDITYKTAICKETGNDAPFSFLTTFQKETKEKVIGGSDLYKAFDRETYLKHTPFSNGLGRSFVKRMGDIYGLDIDTDKVKFDYTKPFNKEIEKIMPKDVNVKNA